MGYMFFFLQTVFWFWVGPRRWVPAVAGVLAAFPYPDGFIPVGDFPYLIDVIFLYLLDIFHHLFGYVMVHMKTYMKILKEFI